VFVKNYSPQVLKANMRVVGATEYAILFYRTYLPKFRNDGHMVFNWFDWKRDGKEIPKIHPAQKPVGLIKRLIEIFVTNLRQYQIRCGIIGGQCHRPQKVIFRTGGISALTQIPALDHQRIIRSAFTGTTGTEQHHRLHR
jgi:hypothetical protein